MVQIQKEGINNIEQNIIHTDNHVKKGVEYLKDADKYCWIHYSWRNNNSNNFIIIIIFTI